ncbi:uncharacterized protein LOC107273121 isoform X2 [Cephus cinctus]|uniref:Uncharacterized protein LOC107273121 isoform X2 n=1 Tax=Cephus cinctus TaxID=211228 RepID=A0AAJ7CB70_CEPCN|nr:uncharacterized protein LOC107273121 isoform X2 [Cephus cinctus]
MMYLLVLLLLLDTVLGTQPEVQNDGSETNKYKKIQNVVLSNKTRSGDDQPMSIFNNSEFHLNFIIDPKQPLAEIVLTNLLMSLATSIPTNASRRLSKSSLDNESAINKIKLIGGLIRDQINVIAQDLRLFRESRAKQQLLITLKNRYSGNLIENTIREGYLTVRCIGEIIKEVYSKVTSHFGSFINSFRRHGYKMMNVQTKNNQVKNYENTFNVLEQFIDTIINMEECLNSDWRHYDLRAAFMKLTGRSSSDSLRLIKKRLNRPLSRFLRTKKTYKQLYALFICQIAVDTFRRDFEKCLEEMERIEECMNKFDTDLYIPNNWTRSIKYLKSSCTNTKDSNGFYNINCNNKIKIPKSLYRQVQLIFKGLSGSELKASPILNDVADDLVKILEKSDFGRKACYQLCRLSMIYQTGLNKKTRLEKMIHDDNQAIGEFTKVFQNLHDFRNGILQETVHVVNKLRKCMRSFEKMLSDYVKISLDKSWLEMTQVSNRYFKLFTEVDTQKRSNNATKLIRQKSSVSDPLNDKFHDLNYNIMQLGSSNRNRKVSEESLTNFLQSVNNYSVRKWKHQNTALGCIAKSLLLGTLLVEALACMETLFYNNGIEQQVLEDEV